MYRKVWVSITGARVDSVKKLLCSYRHRLRGLEHVRALHTNQDSTSNIPCADDLLKTDSNAAEVKRFTHTQSEDKRVALLLGYCGQGYYGMQSFSRKRFRKTVERDLLSALAKAGIITEEESRRSFKIGFQAGASRTDKGVSACRQLVSFRRDLTKTVLHDLVEKMNNHLPPEIRIFDCKEVKKHFICWKFCDYRTYSYLLPTYTFAPVDELTKEDYRISECTINEVNDVLSRFKGSHSFYNFTSGLEPNQPSCQRIVNEFKCGKPFIRDGLEFVLLTVKGHSFVLHQIRKMIGLTIAIIRGFTSLDTLSRAWLPVCMHIPTAPGLGLFLEDLHYAGYNKNFAGPSGLEFLSWDEHKDVINSFKEEVIISTIVRKEKKKKLMLKWLALLPYHHFEPSIAAHDQLNRWMMSYLALLSNQNNDCQILSRREINLTDCNGTVHLGLSKTHLDRENRTEPSAVGLNQTNAEARKKPLPVLRPEDTTIAILLGYCGQGFHGMQRSPGVRTVEGELLSALEKAGVVSVDDCTQTSNIRFHRASRTDKGVSACRQLISLRTNLKNTNLSEVVEKINFYLPPEVRVYGCRKVTQSFSCWKMCDSRKYSYLMPSFAFTPMGELTREDYRITASTIDKVNAVMLNFVGSHSFYNFTSKWEPDNPLCQRIITEFKCGELFINDGVEFLTISIKGKSFLLHQIRKMIGLTIAVVRGLASNDMITKAWLPSRIHLPVAPGLGLFLEDLHYETYNKLFPGGNYRDSLSWEEHTDAITKFKDDVITPTIVNRELEDRLMLNWLGLLLYHDYQESTDEDAVGLRMYHHALLNNKNWRR